LAYVPFVSVDKMMRLVSVIGVETFLAELAGYIEADFLRWETFDKTARIPAHCAEGVIELMPTSDGAFYGFKYVNGHPGNTRDGRQTVTAFGVLSDLTTGYPLLFSEMTILTALRTAATSAMAAKILARPDARCMAIIGNGAQSEFQALAFKALLGVTHLRLFDIDPKATEKCRSNLASFGFDISVCRSAEEAVEGADILTTVTADKKNATILSDNMIGAGVHINAVGGDSPGKTELQREILTRPGSSWNTRPKPGSKARSSNCPRIIRLPNSGGSSPESGPGGPAPDRSPCSIPWASPSRISPPCATCMIAWTASACSTSWTCSPIPTTPGIC
jgi:ornithine cyclodeaminase